MKYFLLPEPNDDANSVYKIVKVQDVDINSFLKRHATAILFEGTELSQVICSFITSLKIM